MGFLSFFGSSPLGIALTAIIVILIAAVIFVGVNVILAFSGGPGTPGSPPITINAANAQSFGDKWMALSDTLDAGSPASANFNESEVSSFVDREVALP